MKRYLFLLILLVAGTRLAAQTDSTCAVIQKIYTTLSSKDKIERNKYKVSPATERPGTLGTSSVYKSSISVPGFSNPEFVEGGGSSRMFSTSMEFASYDKATKAWDEFNKKIRACFTSGWTYTEYDEPREVYRSAKLSSDAASFSPTIRYRIERCAAGFKLVLEIVY